MIGKSQDFQGSLIYIQHILDFPRIRNSLIFSASFGIGTLNYIPQILYFPRIRKYLIFSALFGIVGTLSYNLESICQLHLAKSGFYTNKEFF